MGSGVIIYIPSFIKIGSGFQKLMGGGYTYRQQCNLIRILLFFQNKESRLKTHWYEDQFKKLLKANFEVRSFRSTADVWAITDFGPYTSRYPQLLFQYLQRPAGNRPSATGHITPQEKSSNVKFDYLGLIVSSPPNAKETCQGVRYTQYCCDECAMQNCKLSSSSGEATSFSISRQARSPSLRNITFTPQDFLLWGYVKISLYGNTSRRPIWTNWNGGSLQPLNH
jgi:hypothetical protein